MSGGLPKTFTTQWVLDDREFRTAMKNMSDDSKKLLRTFNDFKRAFDAIRQGAQKLYQEFDKLLTSGANYQRLLDANTLGIAKAERATAGLISKMDLLKAANLATNAGLSLTEEQFAEVAKNATVLAQRLGRDVTDAIERVTMGMAKQEKEVLDELGIVFSAIEAQEEYAAVLGKKRTALTSVERQMAFSIKTIEKMKEKVGEQGVAVKTAGDNWEKLKVGVENAYNEAAKWFATSEGDRIKLELMTKGVQGLAGAFNMLAGRINQVDVETLELLRTLSILGPDFQALLDALITLKQTPERTAAAAKALAESGLLAGMGEGAFGGTRTEIDVGGREYLVGAGGRGGGAIGPSGLFATSPLGKGKAGKKKGARRAGAGSGVGPYGLGGWRSPSGAEFGPEGVAEKQAEILRQHQAERDEVRRLIDAYKSLTDAKAEVRDADLAFVEMQENKIAVVAGFNKDLRDMAFGALMDVHSGILQIADDWIQTGDISGKAILNMIKKMMLQGSMEAFKNMLVAVGFAMDMTAKAAQPIVGAAWAPAASTAWASVAKWGMISGALGAGGLAMSGVTSAMGGGGGGGSDRDAYNPRGGADAYRPSYGQRQAAQRQPLIVNLYVNGSDIDPGASLIGQAKVMAVMAKAA